MANNEIESAIKEIDEKLVHFPDDFSLYYERGYLYYLLGNEQQAQCDYIKSVNLGLDCTRKPYYEFCRPVFNYNLWQKIALVLAAIFLVFVIFKDFWGFLLKLKQYL
ncbi:TPA: hypothetical protein IAD52_05690 [Candidatus Spyradomonas excrementavium]|nr:hypothetical protein [Candidatus Spyradomonas excrementavium]